MPHSRKTTCAVLATRVALAAAGYILKKALAQATKIHLPSPVNGVLASVPGVNTCRILKTKLPLNRDKKDKWGLPTLEVDCEFKENEKAMRKDMMNSAAEMLEKAGLKNITTHDNAPAPGFCIHEMGTARMGKDPKTSVLNGNNQLHEVKNVFISDGACMASSACQNPSITYMALTARAADFAVTELKKGNL